MTFITKKQSHICNAFIKETLQIHFVLTFSSICAALEISIFNSQIQILRQQAGTIPSECIRSLVCNKMIYSNNDNEFSLFKKNSKSLYFFTAKFGLFQVNLWQLLVCCDLVCIHSQHKRHMIMQKFCFGDPRPVQSG